MDRDKILAEVSAEMAQRHVRLGGPQHDDESESEQSFMRYVREYAEGLGRGAGHDFRRRMLKAAACALAAVERHDRLRQRKEPL
jgi:hypothetical protein